MALWQANHLINELHGIGREAELKIIETKGDKSTQHFSQMSGVGFFTKEIEEALIDERVDIAIHSLKDLPTIPTEGLTLGGVSYREDPRDILIIGASTIDESMPLRLKKNARVGTSSARRKALLSDIRSDVQSSDIRGNVPTRIEKLRSGVYDAIILAKAGVVRLNLDLSDFKTLDLHPAEFIPAPGQGALAYQCRSADGRVRKALAQLHHPQVAKCTNIERQVLSQVGAGCIIPLGCYCHRDQNGYYHVHAAYQNEGRATLSRTRHSSSTSFELANKIVTDLLS